MTATTPVKEVKHLRDFVGKTIKHVNTSAVNQVEITFTDGTELRLEAENAGLGVLCIGKYVPKG